MEEGFPLLNNALRHRPARAGNADGFPGLTVPATRPPPVPGPGSGIRGKDPSNQPEVSSARIGSGQEKPDSDPAVLDSDSLNDGRCGRSCRAVLRTP